MEIEIIDSRPVSPATEALYEAGKEMLVDSLSVGRDFSQFMVGGATGAIPVYLALLTFALPANYRPGWGPGIGFFLPAAGLLTAAAVFAVAVFPLRGNVSLDMPATIEDARRRSIDRRVLLAKIGFALFAVATAASVATIIWALSVQVKPAPSLPTKVEIVK